MMENRRLELLHLGAEFLSKVCRLEGIGRIALVGSLCTAKPDPKDIDFLVSVTAGSDLAGLAALSRRLKGGAQSLNRGADIFLVEDGRYSGRICGFRECRPRVRCRARHCGLRPHLNDDLDAFTLRPDLIADPPLLLWPVWKAHADVPRDTLEGLGIFEPGS